MTTRTARRVPIARLGVSVIAIGVLVGVGLIVFFTLSWAYRQPMSTDTLGPAERSLMTIAIGAGFAGVLLGLPTSARFQIIVTAMAIWFSGVVAFVVSVVVGLAQPCSQASTCDIDVAPASAATGIAVWVAVAMAMSLGFAIAFLGRRALGGCRRPSGTGSLRPANLATSR